MVNTRVYYAGQGATNVAAQARHFSQQTSGALIQLQARAALLQTHNEGPQTGMVGRAVSCAISTIADPLGLGWVKSSFDDLSKGTSFGLSNSCESPSAYICSSGDVYCNGYQVTNPQAVQAFHTQSKYVDHIVSQGPKAVEAALARTNEEIRDIELVGKTFASKGHDTGIGTGNGSNNAPEFDPAKQMYASGPAAPKGVGALSYNI